MKVEEMAGVVIVNRQGDELREYDENEDIDQEYGDAAL